MNISELQSKTNAELHELAKEYSVAGYTKMRKQDLIMEMLKAEPKKKGSFLRKGVLEISPTDTGFACQRLHPGPDDVYVSPSQIRRFNLRTGDLVLGQVRRPKDGERYYALLRVKAVNMRDPDQAIAARLLTI